MVGDFNVAPDHKKDTLSYLPNNSQNSRCFIERMKSLNMLTDIFKHKHPNVQQYTYNKSKLKIKPEPILIDF